MARSALTKTASSRNLTGLNLGTMTFATMTLGATNGKYWTHAPTDVILLKNDTGGDAVFTVAFTQGTEYTRFGMTVTVPTITLATGKVLALRVGELLTAAGVIAIDCDVAGKIAVLDCP